MSHKQTDFEMGIPGKNTRTGNYAFWMSTSDKRLVAAVRGMSCVVGMKRSRLTGRILVELSHDHDPDEAWHWIRREVEETINDVELDPIWVEALKWIL